MKIIVCKIVPVHHVNNGKLECYRNEVGVSLMQKNCLALNIKITILRVNHSLKRNGNFLNSFEY